jgi:threonine dehydrogenase-like Zn-dependent dehydrogenase
MALSQAAYKMEQATGHGGDAITKQDIAHPSSSDNTGDASETMKALCWQGKNTVQVMEVAKPKIIEDRDVIVKVTGTTVCGSDMHLLHGVVMEMQKGDVLGHEFCGVVDEVGPGVHKLQRGDRVVASFHVACGECFYCKQGLSSQCECTNENSLEKKMYGERTALIFGHGHLVGGLAGGQAEFVRVPLADVNLLKLPPNVPDEKGLYLSDTLSTSWHCVVDTGVKEGDVVAIWGAGPIGQMCCDFSFLQGASRVIMIDSNWRLDFMKQKYPKVETLDYSRLPQGETVTSKLKEMVNGRGPDVCLECAAGEYAKGWAHYFEITLGMETDTSEIINEMITSVRNFGRCGITGVYMGFMNHFNIGSLMQRGVSLIGNGQAPVHLYWDKLLKMIEDGEIDPLKMVSHRFDIKDLDQVYYDLNNRKEGMQKVFVQTRFSANPAEGSPQMSKSSEGSAEATTN